jgi:hypothetical protein
MSRITPSRTIIFAFATQERRQLVPRSEIEATMTRRMTLVLTVGLAAGSIPRLPTPRERTRPTSSPSLCSCKRRAFGAEEEGFEPSIPR